MSGKVVQAKKVQSPISAQGQTETQRSGSGLERRRKGAERMAFFVKNAGAKRTLLRRGTAEGIRTPDLLVRSQSLYPTELQPHTVKRIPLDSFIIIAQGHLKCKRNFPVFLFFSRLWAVGFVRQPRDDLLCRFRFLGSDGLPLLQQLLIKLRSGPEPIGIGEDGL